jgi:ribosomal protein S18 acetylase RimI-like enzyme
MDPPPAAVPLGPARWARAAAAGLLFRPVTDDDLPFLERLYASTRVEELAPVPWPEETKAAFLAMQFRAQHAHYGRHYADADRFVIARADTAVGRLYVARWAREHRIVDIAFLPEHCGRGLGGALMRDLLDEAAACQKVVRIHVEKQNPAMRFYRRLGFRPVEDKGAHDLLEWAG